MDGRRARQASDSTLPSASPATTSPRARLSSPTSKVPTWMRRSGSGHTSSGLVRVVWGWCRGWECAGRCPPLTGSVLPSPRRPLPGSGWEPRRAGLWLWGAGVPGRAAGAPGAVRGAEAPAAGLHAAAARGRPALPAAPAPGRRQPHDAAFPGVAAAPGSGRPGPRPGPVTGRMRASLVPQFLLLLLLYTPTPCKQSAVRSRWRKPPLGRVVASPGSPRGPSVLGGTPACGRSCSASPGGRPVASGSQLHLREGHGELEALPVVPAHSLERRWSQSRPHPLLPASPPGSQKLIHHLPSPLPSQPQCRGRRLRPEPVLPTQ